MPWVDEDMCVGCGVCVEECPVDCIAMPNETAHIDNEECIRCGICHGVCPEDAVRHDGERVPLEIDANMDWTRDLLKHYETKEERAGFVERMRRHFKNQRKIAEESLERLDTLDI
ncbi:MAG: 4Fe-4S binding protein [Planctomycetes bacterium]|nr:4Fe-4S binding protein [Planctomycetota bacterium]